MKRNICKMCLVEKELTCSHLLPAALYDYCRKNDVSPVRVGNGVVFHTDRQTKDYLLCSDCEGVLNKGGESWINSKFASMEKIFPLYELVVRSPGQTFVEGEAGTYFATGSSGIDALKVTHFAMGIFWKASVHSWEGNSIEPMIDLGSYSDTIRLWLRGKRPFPDNVSLTFMVCRPETAQITLLPPTEGVNQGWRTFYFHVLGALFTLSIGEHLSPEMRMCCFARRPDHPMFVSEDLNKILKRHFTARYMQSRKTEQFLKSKAKRDELRRAIGKGL